MKIQTEMHGISQALTNFKISNTGSIEKLRKEIDQNLEKYSK